MNGILWNLASFIIALGILVAIHEFGHFWVARKCGVKVEKFSIGFGKSIWRRVAKDGTEYSLSMIPLGGFVKMLDGRVADIPEDMQQYAFDKKPLWQRSAIVAAGPLFNFIFAIVAYWLVFLIGVPSVKPVIGEVFPQSIIAQADIQPGMVLTEIDGVATRDWESVNMGLISHIGDDEMRVTLTSSVDSTVQETKLLDIRDWQFDPESESAMQSLGFLPYRPDISLDIAALSADGAAIKAGLLVGDKLVALNQVKLENWQQVVDIIQASPNIPVDVLLLRDGVELNLSITPDSKESQNGRMIGLAGVSPKVGEWPDGYRFDLTYGPVEAIGKAINKTGQVIDLTFSMLKKLVVGDVGLNNLSGPISIAKGAGATAGFGLVYFLGFLALISVNLGIINLMPLPILDGGHLLFYAIEAMIRRPIPEKVQEMGFRFGGIVIFSLMAIAIFNDFMRL